MSLILCRVRLSVWEGGRPDVGFVAVEKQNKKFLYLVKKAEIRGRKTDRVNKRELERVIREEPGAASFLWVQDDREPITDGIPCRMGQVAILDELRADLHRAAIRLMEMEEEANRADFC